MCQNTNMENQLFGDGTFEGTFAKDVYFFDALRAATSASSGFYNFLQKKKILIKRNFLVLIGNAKNAGIAMPFECRNIDKSI